MSDFFSFFYLNWKGILVFILLIIFCFFILEKLARLFQFGRYNKNAMLSERNGELNRQSSVVYLFVELIVKIITDFRHFLALLLVLIFTIALCYALYISESNIDNLSKALQAVVSTLGGLVGSIVGYYFGESAAKKSTEQQSNNESQIIRNNNEINDIIPIETPQELS